MKLIIRNHQAITLIASVWMFSQNIDAAGNLRGGGSSNYHASSRFLASITTGETKGDFCAGEKQTCKIDGVAKTSGQIRYGDAGSNQFSNWKNITGDKSFYCQSDWDGNHKGFGMDPKRGSKKNCYWREGPSEREMDADKSIKKCANDGANCSCLGGQARYGQYAKGNKAGDRWTNWIDVEGSTIKCGQSAFGGFDPAKGVKKICECRDIPSDRVTFDNYDGLWERVCENCNNFNYKSTFTYSEGNEDSVSEAFMDGWSLTTGVSVGYKSGATGGAESSVSVSNTIQESYQRTSTAVITSSREQSTETSCAITSCERGSLFRFMIEGKDIQGNPALVATCNFVCIPHENQQDEKKEPVCPLEACNLYEHCQCALFPWASDEARAAGVDEKLCTAAPTSAPTLPPTSAPTLAPVENPDYSVIPADKIVLSCTDVKCSDGSDGSSCDRYGGCCPFLSTQNNNNNNNNGEEEKCYCGLSHEDAKENEIPCNYHLTN